MNKDKFGWIVAAGMAGALAMSGFQGQSLKFANCDIGKVTLDSPIYKQNTQELDTFRAGRMSVLNFITENADMVPADAKSFADLSLTKSLSDADKAKLQKIKDDAAAQVQAHRAIATKTPPLSADDNSQLGTFRQREAENKDYASKLYQQYQNDMNNEGNRLQTEADERVRKVIQGVANKQGYNIVFGVAAAPYAANDITSEVEKELQKS